MSVIPQISLFKWDDNIESLRDLERQRPRMWGENFLNLKVVKILALSKGPSQKNPRWIRGNSTAVCTDVDTFSALWSVWGSRLFWSLDRIDTGYWCRHEHWIDSAYVSLPKLCHSKDILILCNCVYVPYWICYCKPCKESGLFHRCYHINIDEEHHSVHKQYLWEQGSCLWIWP